MAFYFDPEMLDDGDLMNTLFSHILFPHFSTRNSRPRVPTHTEDGIPIRKIYVSNLPTDTKRYELMEIFATYGEIKNCWVKGASEFAKPYAFITFVEPADAHKALKAHKRQCVLRGKFLRVSPADSWHQPGTDAEGNVVWNNRRPVLTDQPQASEEELNTPSTSYQASTSQASNEERAPPEPQYDILDILNHDCMTHVMSYVPLHDLIRSEAVSKRWRDTVLEHFLNIHTFKTSSWKRTALTTNKLRQLLRRMPNLKRLMIDEHGPSLNDRTAQTIARFCTDLQTLIVEDMATKFWTPVATSCKDLHTVVFTSCELMNDQSLASLLSTESSIQHVSLIDLREVKGGFVQSIVPKLKHLTIDHCNKLERKLVCDSVDKLTDLTYLCLDMIYTPVNSIIQQLPKLGNLEELHLYFKIGYAAAREKSCQCMCDELTEGFKCLPKLRCLSLIKNRCLHNRVLLQIAETCKKLTHLDITCYSDGDRTQLESMAGFSAVVSECTNLQHVNVSMEHRIPAILKLLSGCHSLRSLVARGSSELLDDTLEICISKCHLLENIDVSSCSQISMTSVMNCIHELEQRPRPLTLYVGDTAITEQTCFPELPTHEQLTVKCYESDQHFIGPRFYLEPDDDMISDYGDFESDDEFCSDFDSDDYDYILGEYEDYLV